MYALQVFYSDNSEGKSLTSSDKINAVIVKWALLYENVQKWVQNKKSVSEDELQDFFNTLMFFHIGERCSKDNLNNCFISIFGKQAKADFKSFIDYIREKMTLYSNIRRANFPNKEVNEILDSFRQLKFKQSYVLIFSTICNYGMNIVKDNVFCEFLYILRKMFVRMQICKRNMNVLDSIFSECISMMKKGDLASINAFLRKKKEEMIPDEVFITSFSEFSTKSTKISEFILIQIEEFLRKKHKNRNMVQDGLTIEHIIPRVSKDSGSSWVDNNSFPIGISKDEKEKIVESIGNKLLLFGDDNSSAGCKDYLSKVDVYRNGKKGQKKGAPVKTFQLVGDLVKSYPSSFSYVEVKKRAQKLARLAVEIW